MPRQARRKSKSGIYHILLRGINRQQIFEDNEDFEKFLEVLKAGVSFGVARKLYNTQNRAPVLLIPIGGALLGSG